jgi:RNA polymerase sigma-70 factor (ECF subfamily)
MNDATATFIALRPRLHGIAYRMLGSVAEAEDVVQDVWISWNEAAQGAIANAEAWLVAATSRRSIDRLRAARTHREHYVGIWLPEPIEMDASNNPEALEELSSDISVAFLMLLERLTPEARAAFLLREVFDVGYDEVASIVGKTEASCRQMVHRAKEQLRDDRPRFQVPRERHLDVVRRFAKAMTDGDFPAIRALLDPQATLTGDGGGKVPSFGVPVVGAQRLAQLYYAPFLRFRHGGLRIDVRSVNGEPALFRYFNGVLESVQTFVTDGERIVAVYAQRNPEKLVRLV